ncbi:hypothetical protein HMPREF0731_2911, partial [Pseudoroseomonas cervicalis ATCC 49957]
RSASGRPPGLRPPRPSEASGYYGAVLCFLCYLAEQEASAPLIS